MQLIKEMERMPNFKIAFFTNVEHKENFRNKKSKQYIKCALPLNRKKTQKKKDRNAYNEQKTFINNPINIPVPRTIFFFSPNSTLAI